MTPPASILRRWIVRDQLEAEYRRLLRHGITWAARPDAWLLDDVDEERRQWQRTVAEPWWSEVRERAARDGLQIACLRENLLLVGADHELFFPAASLLDSRGTPFETTYDLRYAPGVSSQARAHIRAARRRARRMKMVA